MKVQDLKENVLWDRNEDTEDPEVLVQGVGRYRLSQLKENLRRKITDIAQIAEKDTPDSWEQLNYMLNHAAMREMIKTVAKYYKEIH